MAKMFYTLEEVCSKLEKNEDEVRDLVRTSQIQEFRDRDKLMFKVEQIDLLASGEEDTSDVHLELEGTGSGTGMPAPDESSIGLAESRVGLADSREGTGLVDASSAGSSGLGLADSREAISLSDSREGTGVSIFDTDHGDDTGTGTGTGSGDKTAASEAIEEELSLDAVGSGSGLLDLTRESDDTSLGAELLEEVYASEENLDIPAHASGLFEAASAERPVQEVTLSAAPAGVPMVMEVYDGAGSGLGAGLLIGAIAALVCVAIVAIVGVGGASSMLAMKIAATDSSIWMWAGGLAGMTVVLGLVGVFIGKASG